MKTIIDAVKEKEKMRRQYEIRMKKINGLKEIKEDNKESTNKDFLEEENKKGHKVVLQLLSFTAIKIKKIIIILTNLIKLVKLKIGLFLLKLI